MSWHLLDAVPKDGTRVLFFIPTPAWCTDRLAGAEELSGVGERPLSCPWMPIVPFKLNQDRRHHIPRQRRTVTNWPAYDASLRQRGSLTVWFTEEAVEAWAAEPRTTRGGQPWYSALAVLTALTLRCWRGIWWRQSWFSLNGTMGIQGQKGALSYATQLLSTSQPIHAPVSGSGTISASVS